MRRIVGVLTGWSVIVRMWAVECAASRGWKLLLVRVGEGSRVLVRATAVVSWVGGHLVAVGGQIPLKEKDDQHAKRRRQAKAMKVFAGMGQKVKQGSPQEGASREAEIELQRGVAKLEPERNGSPGQRKRGNNECVQHTDRFRWTREPATAEVIRQLRGRSSGGIMRWPCVRANLGVHRPSRPAII
jgi:hypothetical protein